MFCATYCALTRDHKTQSAKINTAMRIQEILLEGLTRSVDRETLRKLFQRNFPDIELRSYGDPGFKLKLYVSLGQDESEETLQKMQRFLDTVGWFISSKIVGGHTSIEPRYDIVVTEVPRMLYHITPRQKLSKISKKGLSPRQSNETKHLQYPARIYLATNKDSAEEIAKRFSKGDYFSAGDGQEYSLLQIDTTMLPVSTTFYYDVNFMSKDEVPKGVYTVDYIPVKAIKILSYSIQI